MGPRSLNDVIDHERHILQAIDGNTKDMFYNSVVGLSDDYQSKKEDELENQVENIEKKEVVDEDNKDEEKDDEEEDEDDEEGDEEGKEPELTPYEKQKLLETMSKKDRKAYVKEQNREKRKTKTPKHIKKRRKK